MIVCNCRPWRPGVVKVRRLNYYPKLPFFMCMKVYVWDLCYNEFRCSPPCYHFPLISLLRKDNHSFNIQLFLHELANSARSKTARPFERFSQSYRRMRLKIFSKNFRILGFL